VLEFNEQPLTVSSNATAGTFTASTGGVTGQIMSFLMRL
jgi:hypothetical protein